MVDSDCLGKQKIVSHITNVRVNGIKYIGMDELEHGEEGGRWEGGAVSTGTNSSVGLSRASRGRRRGIMKGRSG